MLVIPRSFSNLVGIIVGDVSVQVSILEKVENYEADEGFTSVLSWRLSILNGY